MAEDELHVGCREWVQHLGEMPLPPLLQETLIGYGGGYDGLYQVRLHEQFSKVFYQAPEKILYLWMREGVKRRCREKY